MSTMKTYDPKQISVAVTFNSTKKTYLIGGFADGTSIKVTRSADAYSKSVGMDGDTSRVKNPDTSGEITLTLAQTSVSNDILSTLAGLTSDGDTASILVKDIYGNSLHSSSYVWAKKQADAEYAKALTNREWVMECADLYTFVGGSSIS